MSIVHRRTVHPFGVRFAMTADDPRVPAAADAALARYARRPLADGPTLRLAAHTVPDTADDPAWPTTAATFVDGRLTLTCGGATLHADATTGRAELALPPSLAAVPDAVRMFVEGAASTLLINAGHLHAVHAGLVSFGGRNLLLRGRSGAGKSTITYACLRAGAAVASDDWVYAVPGEDPAHLWGYPWRLFLVAEALGFFPELAGRDAVLHPGADRLKIPIEPPVAQRRRRARIDAVVFLDPDPDLGVRPVGAAEAAERFWEPALPTERRDLPEAFVGDLLDRPCFVLRRGTDPNRAATRLQELARTSA